MAAACARRDVADALRPIIACGDSARLAPGCARSSAWNKVLVSNGSHPSAAVDWRQARCAREAFDAYLCGLQIAPAGAVRPRPPDWAFSDDPPSVGKFIARWAMGLYLRSVAFSPFRHTLPEDELREWQWLPKRGCASASASPREWFTPDVCSRVGAPLGANGPLTTVPRSRAWRAVASLARGNSSGRWRQSEDPFWVATAGGGITTPGLWWAGQLVRHVRAALGPCARAAMAEERRRLVVLAEGGWRRAGDGGASRTIRRSERPLTIAVHMRRGDACERWARRGDGMQNKAVGGRPCYAAAEYMAAVHALVASVRHGGGELARRVGGGDGAVAGGERVRLLVASDSEKAAAELAVLAQREGIELVHLQGRRGAGWGGVDEGANVGKSGSAAAKEFIEARNSRGIVDRRAVLGSLLADLELLSEAHAFVGTAASWTSRITLLAIIGERGVVPPFALVDRPLGQLWFA